MPELKEKLLAIKQLLLENRNTKQTIAKNTFWLSISEVVGRLLRVLVIIYAARVLGAAGWGTFSYLTSLAAVFTIFSDIGISSVLIREATKSPESRAPYFSTALILKFVLIAVSLGILILASTIFTGIPISKTLMLFIGLLFILDSLRRFGTSLFRADEQMEREALVNIITQSVIVAGGFTALLLFRTPETLAMAYAFGAGIGLLITARILKRHTKKLFSSFDRSLVGPIIKAAWPFSLGAVFGALLVNVDTVMIGWFREAAHIGYYSAAQKPIVLLYILPTLIVGSFFPALARFAEKSRDQFREIIERGIHMTLIVAFPIAVGIILTADQIADFLYGPEYAASAAPLRILGLTILTAFPVSLLIHGIFAHNRQKELVPFWAAGTILNILMNLFLIPRLGISGAAWSSLFTQILVNSLIWRKMQKISFFKIGDKLFPILLATFIMSAAVILIRQFGAHLIITVAFGASAYFASLIASGVNPLRQLKGALGKAE